MLKFSLCDYSDAYIFVKRTITIAVDRADVAAQRPGKRNKQVIFKNYVLFTICIIKIIKSQVDNASHHDVVVPMYYLIENPQTYDKPSRILWQYHKDATSNQKADSKSFKFKARIKGSSLAACNTKDFEIEVSLKNVSNF